LTLLVSLFNNCPHASHHLQCILSYFIEDRATLTVLFRTHHNAGLDAQGNYGEAHYWAPEDYYNFAKAFLRTKPAHLSLPQA